MPKKAIVLVSGGMDSVTALYEAARTFSLAGTLSFDYGSKHNHREIPFAAFHAQQLKIPHQVIRLDFVGDLFKSALLKSAGPVPDGHYEDATMRQTVVPFRNGIMLSIAAGYAESVGAEVLVIAAHSGDHAIYPDCREEFMQSMSDAVRLGTYAGIGIERPFIHLTKAGIVRRAMELGVDLSQTWSCYKGLELHCGTCGTCVERREAFILAGVPDPTRYANASPLPPRPGSETRKASPER
jgi:7-cyano-7-deazaguanine synthase